MKYFKNILLLAAIMSCFAIGPTARADEAGAIESKTNLFEMLSQRGVQSSLMGKDLTAAWRMLRITAGAELDALVREIPGRNQGGTPWDNLYYTRGDVIAVSGQIYLVAYRVMPPSDPAERQRQQQFWQAWQSERATTNLQNEIPPLEEKSQLLLSLLTIGKSTSLTNIRAFNPEKDLLTEDLKSTRKTEIERTMSRANLKQIALGIMQYTQDYDEMLPPMRAARTSAEFTNVANDNSSATSPVQLMVLPYVRNTQIFLHPGTGRPYLPNYKISRKNLAGIQDAAATILFFEDAPDSENKRSVVFLDGHVETLDEADWQRRRKAQGISESGLPSAAVPKGKPKPTTNRRTTNVAAAAASQPPPAAPRPPPPASGW